MSRNLTSSTCVREDCNHTFRLEDLRGKPIEFRRYGPYAPVLGCRVDCQCGAVYFAMWRRRDTYWDKASVASGKYADDETVLPNGQIFPNKEKGRFVTRVNGTLEQTGYFVIDLSHYESYNDESWGGGADYDAVMAGEQKPAHLCEDDAEDTQWVW